jgi:hypothetical protein
MRIFCFQFFVPLNPNVTGRFLQAGEPIWRPVLWIAFVLVAPSVDLFYDINIVYKPSCSYMFIGALLLVQVASRYVRCQEILILVDCFGRAKLLHLPQPLFPTYSIMCKDNTKNKIIFHNVMTWLEQ